MSGVQDSRPDSSGILDLVLSAPMPIKLPNVEAIVEQRTSEEKLCGPSYVADISNILNIFYQQYTAALANPNVANTIQYLTNLRNRKYEQKWALMIKDLQDATEKLKDRKLYNDVEMRRIKEYTDVLRYLSLMDSIKQR